MRGVDALVVGPHPRLDGEEQHLQVALLLKPAPERAQCWAPLGAPHHQTGTGSRGLLLGGLLHGAVRAEGLQLVLHPGQ